MHIERAPHADDELVAAFAKLLPQLTPTASRPSRADLAKMVASPSTYLLIATIARPARSRWRASE